MALSKFRNQRDKNEPDIIAEFKARGFTVEKMDKPVDLLIGKWGVNYLIEVKNPDTPYYKGTETQVKWIAEWPGQIATISTVEEAAGFCQAVSAAREVAA